MMSTSVAFFVVFSACLVSEGIAKNWALVAQTSKGWVNYVDQASTCHAYKTMHKAGIPDENIVVMHYDDCANYMENPYPGTLRNSPNGHDVYKGTPKDYTGTDISRETILAALSGDEDTIFRILKRKGKVINSTSEDNIFLYITDHGGDKIIYMPEDSLPPLHARELNDTLTKMYREKRYANLVIYLDTCFSGSMFQDVLSPDINVYAVSAASPKQFAWNMYCDNKFNTCLASEFSCNWLGDQDFSGVKKTTFEDQFLEISKTMIASTPHQYGNLSMDKDLLEVFFGKNDNMVPMKNGVPKCKHPDMQEEGGEFSIPANEGRIFSIKSRLRSVPAHSKLRSELEEELADVEKMMAHTENLFLDISRPFYRDIPEAELANKIFDRNYGKLEHFDCYEDAVDYMMTTCPDLNPNINPATSGKFVSIARLCNRANQRDVMSSVRISVKGSPLCRPNNPTFSDNVY